MGFMENQSVSEVARKWVCEASEAELEVALAARRLHQAGDAESEVTIEAFDAAFGNSTAASEQGVVAETGTVSEAEFEAAFGRRA